MLLQRIKIKGFKSFPDQVELELERGITGIVGPNGCGKSNIADSINWALGEQSPTVLRGKRMEQMIFNGSSSRKAMGSAEVELELRANGDMPKLLETAPDEQDLERQGSSLPHLLGDGDGRITLTRRMFRDAQSEYLLNGKPCRLRDIQDLLMALGMGSRVVTIIEQDRINAILNAKPVDRRELIEDAAGITKFKLNRHLTQLKLQRTGQNLQRIEDLLAEQGVHLRRLRRQASLARRFRRLQAEIRDIETSILSARHSELRRRQMESSSKVGKLEDRLAAASAELSTAESKHASLRQRVDELTAQQVAMREKHYQSTLDIDRDSNRLRHLRESLDGLFQRSEQAAARLQEAQRTYKTKSAQLDETKQTKLAQEKELDLAKERQVVLRSEVDNVGSDLESLRSQKEARLQQISGLREKMASERSRVEAMQTEEKRLGAAVTYAAALREKLAGSISEAGDRLSQLQQRLATLDDQVLANEGELQRRIDENGALKKEIEAIDRRAEALKRSHGNATATLEALQEMERRREGVEEAVRALFENEELKAEVKPLGLVAESFEIGSDVAKAVIAAYGRQLEAVVVESVEDAEKGLQLLRERELGRAEFVPLSRLKPGEQPAFDQTDLRASLKPQGDRAALLLQLFEPARLVDGVAEALDASAAKGCRLAATPKGFVARDGKAVRGGSDAAKQKVFGRRAEIKEIQRQVTSTEKELRKFTAEAEALAARKNDLEAEILNLRAEVEAARVQRAELSAQAKAGQSEHERLEDSLAVKDREIGSFQQQREQNGSQLAAAAESLASLQKEVDALSSGLDEFDNRLRTSTQVAGEVQRRESELNAEISAIEERARANRASTAALERDITQLLERIASSQEEIKLIEDERTGNLHEIESIESGLEAKVGNNERLKSSLSEFDGRLKELSGDLTKREAEVKRCRALAEEIQHELEQGRLEAREHILEIQHLRERAAENLKIGAEELESAQQDEEEEIDLEASQAKLEDLKQKLEQLGPVNLLASEEYERHQERHRFLNDQRQDIVDSIASLEKVISRIDRVCRKRFSEAFEAINENFHKTFRRMFGGGKAELKLEEGDLLAAGIEIMVQPPGKRPQSAMLLSGGEKSLSAFSLIMAVLQFRPTPFCVLDEADAALDELNTRRIANMLHEHSESTQFILITHNKTTMEVADRLYGVTMDEPGVSRLVSVKFN